MADIVDKATRSRMMSGIRGKDTKPEVAVRKGLHSKGFRYIKNDRRLPGKPDLVFPRYKAVVQVHGCYWHGHDCHLFRLPSSNTQFWAAKIDVNRANDLRSTEMLLEAGWRVLVVWECALKGKSRIPMEDVLSQIATWLKSPDGGQQLVISGRAAG